MDVHEAQSFWESLRRAPIARALAVYAGTAFAVMQGADIFTNQFGLPDWFFQGTVVILAVALVVLVITAHRYGTRRERASARRASTGEGGEAPEGTDPGPARSDGDAPVGKAPVGKVPVGKATGDRGADDDGPAAKKPLLTWRRLSWGGVMALAGWGFVVALYMVMRSLGIGPVGTLVGAGVLEARERVIISEFDARPGDELLASAATEAFRIDLSQSPMVSIVEPQYLSRVLGRMERDPAGHIDFSLAREVALREGIKAVIGGEIHAVGGGFVLTARLVAAETGDVLAAFRETAADSAAIIPAIDRLSSRLRERIGESLRTIRQNEPLARVTTGSLEALRRYTQGVRAREQGDVTRARELLQEAVALDSTFAMAWRTLGLVAPTRTERVEALNRAYQLRDRLTERERYLTLGTHYSLVTHETDRAIAAYRTLLETHPDDSWALNNLAVQYNNVRDFRRAEEHFALAVAADSLSATGYSNLANTQFALGRVEEARRTLERFQSTFPGHPMVTQRRVELASSLGDYEEAERLVREFAEARRGDPQARIMAGQYLTWLALVRGRLAEADGGLREVSAGAREAGLEGMDLQIELARAFYDIWFRADTAGAVRRIAAVGPARLEALDPLERPYGTLAQLHAMAGQTDRARQFLARLEAVEGPELRGEAASVRESIVGLILLREGQAGDALEALRRADIGPCPICALPVLGIALEAAGEPDSALAAFETFVTTPWMQRLQTDAAFLPFAYERLAALHEARGEPTEAAEYHARLLALWAEADPELRPRVDHARRALEALPAEDPPAAAADP